MVFEELQPFAEVPVTV
jgi:hypothetical protein